MSRWLPRVAILLLACVTSSRFDATGSGCLAGTVAYLHMNPLNTQPHDPAASSHSIDDTASAGRAVVTAHFDRVGS